MSDDAPGAYFIFSHMHFKMHVAMFQNKGANVIIYLAKTSIKYVFPSCNFLFLNYQ